MHTPSSASTSRRRALPQSAGGGVGPGGEAVDVPAARRARSERKELRTSDKDFKRLMVLGRGAFAKVVLVEDRRTGIRYAMKVLNKHHVVHKRQAEHTMTERHILTCTSRHPFIVNLKFAYRTETTLNLVMDLCPGGELFYHLSKEGRFEEPRARFVAAELTLALGHLHAQGVVYRDLKPENILIDAEGHVRLADFGLSKEGILNFASGAHTFCGTPEYLAPEILLRRGHGTAVDWWSLGALLYEMLTGLPPWFSQDRKEMYNGIMNGALEIPPYVSSSAGMIMRAFLERDPTRRLGSRGGVMEVRAAPFFADIDWNRLLQKKYVAPWIPPKSMEECFDSTYTQQSVTGNSLAASHVLSSSQIPDFAGFSWTMPGVGSYLAASHAAAAAAAAKHGGDAVMMDSTTPSPFQAARTVSLGSTPPAAAAPYTLALDEDGIVAVRDHIHASDEEDMGSEGDGGGSAAAAAALLTPAAAHSSHAAFAAAAGAGGSGSLFHDYHHSSQEDEGVFQMDLESRALSAAPQGGMATI